LNNAEQQQSWENFINGLIKKWWESAIVCKLIEENKECSLRQAFTEFTQKTRANEAQLSALRKEIEQLKKQLNQQQPLKMSDYSTPLKVNNQQNTTSSSFDKTVEAFNAWAKNPVSFLPSQFNYAEGDLKLREKQNIQFSSAKNATWIINKSGPIKYLFPNPNAIDQVGGKIDALYTVTGNRRARGQNKVNIQNACVIREDGWIEYKGALSLV
jgi:hypothetical protein